ncbi:MAG: SDR family NAD(P)-dependent oxidoreductase [Sphingomonadales bacterium]|nr:MAG: SDR family NAD(P)-dependent oxidoreductase [Sphingomonadales bacterium]
MADVIVTGAFGTLGRAVVAELTQRGHRVAAVDLATAPADCAAALAFGGVDLADEEAVASAYAAAAARLGGLDGLVNVAGGFVWEPVEAGSAESFDRMFRINLRTVAVSSRAALLHLRAPGGAIVNVGAAAAVQPGLGMAAPQLLRRR